MVTEYLADNIKMLCVANRIKQKDLSTEVGLNENRINDIVQGKKIRVTDYEIESIANFFNITVDTLCYKKAYLEFK